MQNFWRREVGFHLSIFESCWCILGKLVALIRFIFKKKKKLFWIWYVWNIGGRQSGSRSRTRKLFVVFPVRFRVWLGLGCGSEERRGIDGVRIYSGSRTN